MKDYRIEIKVKNNLLWNAMQKRGIKNAAQLARATGLNPGTVGDYLNLTANVYAAKGTGYRPSFEKIFMFLEMLPGDIYPEDRMVEPLANNKRVIEANAAELLQLGSRESDPTEVIRLEQRAGALHKLLDLLNEKEALVVRLRSGMDGDPHTLAEIAAVIGRSRERVRQIYARALRKMRRPETLEYAGLDYYTMDLVE